MAPMTNREQLNSRPPLWFVLAALVAVLTVMGLRSRQMAVTSSALQKTCESPRSKRIADLTINDIELLKKCGVAIQVLPKVP